jgi:hypothetical protein
VLTKSNDPDCRAGTHGVAGAKKGVEFGLVAFQAGHCKGAYGPDRSGNSDSPIFFQVQGKCLKPRLLQASGKPLCGPAQPTKLTLAVNGWSAMATKAKPAAYLHHEQDQPLASQTALRIRATIDHPLPKGWKLVVFHNGDVLSQGNGVYYKVCELDGPTTTTSCGATRPGRAGPFDDAVFAQLLAPTYLAMHSDIYFHFNGP